MNIYAFAYFYSNSTPGIESAARRKIGHFCGIFDFFRSNLSSFYKKSLSNRRLDAVSDAFTGFFRSGPLRTGMIPASCFASGIRTL